ncbi:MAG: CAP domain-containing protein [Flavobacteriia bacterium]|nr:CAP domain-containing protein [Flavobacteriia bacterium]
MQKISLLILFVLVLSSIGNTQLSSKNITSLKKELYHLFNNYRVEQSLGTLNSNVILQKAAQSHADFLIKSKKITHDETNSKLKTPLKRIQNAGGDFLIVGENILEFETALIKLKEDQIKELANAVYDAWKVSKEDLKNLEFPEFDLHDFGIAQNTKKQTLIFVHLFSKTTYRVENQLSENDFGLKMSVKPCSGFEYEDEIYTNLGNCVYIEEGKVILEYHNIQHIKDVFKNSNDGFAVDLLSPNQFLCGEENKTDDSPIYDGILLKPVYKDELLRSNTAQSETRLIAQIGTIPESLMKDDFIPAIVIIKNGQACNWASPVEIPHKTYDPIPVDLQTIEEENVKLRNEGIIISKQVYFQFNRNAVTTENHDLVPNLKNPIHSVEITSYSSVEGDSIKNNRLHIGRAEFMKNTITSSNPTKNITIRASENWEKCNFQMEKYDMGEKTKFSHDSIRSILYNDSIHNWDSLFNMQRKSFALVHYFGKFNPKDHDEYVKMNFKTALIERNIPLANKALHELYKNKIPCEFLLEESTINNLFEFPNLVANVAAVLSLANDLNSEEIVRYVRYWLINYNQLEPLAKQNLIYLYSLTTKKLLKEWDVATSQLAKVLHPKRADIVYKTVEKYCSEIITLNYHIGTIEYYSQINDYSSIGEKFNYIDNYFKKAHLSSKDAENLALFYNHWNKEDLTINLLSYHMKEQTLSEEEIFIFVKTIMIRDISKHPSVNVEQLLNLAFKTNPNAFCEWQATYFNLLEDYQIKNFFCEKCME